MKSITFNRILIAMVLIYFPIATYGASRSFWVALQTLCLFLIVLSLGFTEGAQADAAPKDEQAGKGE
jgi:hypothetical protein